MPPRFFPLLLSSALLAGCAGSSELARPRLDLGLIQDASSAEPGFRGPGVGIEKPAGGVRVSEEDIRLAMESAGPLEGPVRVAVVEITRAWEGANRPTSVSPEELAAFREALGGSVESVQTVPQMFLPDAADLPTLRYAAARVGANALFVFNREANEGTYFNAWSNLNWLILPIFCVPGKTAEVYAAAEGALIDVATSRVRAVAAADVRLDTVITTAASSRRPLEELDREGRLKSVELLGLDLGRQVGSLRVGQK